MSDIILEKISNAYIRAYCDDGIAEELKEHFTFLIPNHKFHPMVKSGRWDGKIRLFSKKKVYAGLEGKIIEFAKKYGYSITSKIPKKQTIDPKDIVKFCDSLNVYSGGEKIKHRNYQYASVYYALNDKRKIIVSPTGSGKSQTIYSIVRYLLEEVEHKILIVVPTINLVGQLHSDFEDYSSHNGFDTEANCHRIKGGSDKDSTKRVYISTYQSIQKLDPSWFMKFDAVIIDECHMAKANSFVHVLESSINADYRIGLTGTLDNFEVNELVITGLLGDKKQVATTSALIDKGILSKLQINFYELIYPKEIRKNLNLKDYSEEMDFIVTYDKRNEYIRDLSLSLDGNILVLFNYVEKHGIPLREIISSDPKDKTIHYVDGSVNSEEREIIRNTVENTNNNIIIASFGVYSTGVNIKNLHHIILASSTKSNVRLLQSIGRGLRIKEGKVMCVFHDLCDNLTKSTKKNFTLLHGIERVKIYAQQDFDYNLRKVELK